MLRLALAAGLFAGAITFAQQPLPELRTEATDGGSIFHVRNTGTQPLTAYLIEMPAYPGSYYVLWQDDLASAIPPGGQKRIPVTNMTVGAAPEYVKLQAALFADGSTSGDPEKLKQFIERRRFVLVTTRQLIQRCEKTTDATALRTELQQWADSIPEPTRANRRSQEAVNNSAARALIGETAKALETRSPADVLSGLRSWEQALASSKPSL